MTAKLVAEEGLLKELMLSFEEGDSWVIGRDPDACQLLIEDPAVSRKHAVCRRVSNGIVIVNLSLTNPVLVNDELVIEPHLLQQGDRVKIGETNFRFYIDESAHLFEDKTPSIIPDIIPDIIPEEDKHETPFGAETNIPANDMPVFTTQGLAEEAEKKEKTHDTIFEEEGAKAELAHVSFDLLETGRWLLKVVGGPNNGAEFSMQSGSSYIIGTDPNTCDIVFYDNSVSRQHAKINVSQDDKLVIEDLRSRNGTRVDGEIITTPQPLAFNTLVSVGTTSFIVYDREGEMQTIMSPLLPSIVKALQKEGPAIEEAPVGATAGIGVGEAAQPPPLPVEPAKPSHNVGALILTGILIGLFAVVGLAVQTLFVQEPISIEKPIDVDKSLTDSLKIFPTVKSSFNKTTGRLLLVGHVLTATDKSQLLYNLQGLKFIKDIDDSGVIIDEYVLNEANQVLTKNPNWRGVTVHTPTPGHFVLSGYLQTRSQAEQVWDYLTRNFPYLDLLENKIVVEEDVLATVNNTLHNQGLTTVSAQISTGELTLQGSVPVAKKPILQDLVKQFHEIPGVRSVRNIVSEQAPSEAIVNISDRYLITGTSKIGNQVSVVINGRILTQGDILDGMKITNIKPDYVLLEKDGIMYRINSNR